MKKGRFSALTVACVWFATHIGGGFAGGRQLVDFYVQFGWFSVFTPVISAGIIALVFYCAWSFSVQEKVYDYRSWSVAYYKPLGVLGPVFSLVVEIMFLITLFLATGVAFATGGTLITGMFPHLSYNFVTLVMAAMIFFLAIWGAETVRRISTLVAIFLISGLGIIYITNLAVNFPLLAQVVGGLPSAQGGLPVALWQSVRYAGLQVTLVGAYIAVADTLKTKTDAKKAALIGFGMNAAMMALVATGILAHYPYILGEAVPITLVIERSAGGGASLTLLAVVIFVAVVTTGVNLVYGGARRISAWWAKRAGAKSTRKADIASAVLYVSISWILASFGLISLIAQGYVWVGTLSAPLIIAPVLLVALIHRKRA